MRRFGIILTAGAALVLALVVPTVAEATGKSTTTDKSAEISAQGIGLDDEITAQGKKGGKHAKGGKHGRHGGKRDGYRHGGRSRHGHHGHHYRSHRYNRGYYYYGHPYYGGYYGGGYGCNYDYPCDRPGQTYDCTRYRGPDGQPAGDPHCRSDARCDCYYHSSDRTPEGSQSQPAPEQNTQPAPDGQPAPPAQDAEPAPEQGQPAPDQGSPRPY